MNQPNLAESFSNVDALAEFSAAFNEVLLQIGTVAGPLFATMNECVRAIGDLMRPILAAITPPYDGPGKRIIRQLSYRLRYEATHTPSTGMIGRRLHRAGWTRR